MSSLWPGPKDGGGLHLRSLERQFPGGLRVDTCGYVPAKRDLVDRVFYTDAFSFVVHGTGSYTSGGRTWRVRAPCVLTQRSDEHFTYGPESEWEELWFSIDVGSRDEVRRLGLIDPRRPIWYIGEPEPVLDQMRTLLGWLARRDEPGAADPGGAGDEACGAEPGARCAEPQGHGAQREFFRERLSTPNLPSNRSTDPRTHARDHGNDGA